MKKPHRKIRKDSNVIHERPHYMGITYPNSLDADEWKGCRNQMHLFDETVTSDGEHLLVCDACGMEVHIKKIVIH